LAFKSAEITDRHQVVFVGGLPRAHSPAVGADLPTRVRGVLAKLMTVRNNRVDADPVLRRLFEEFVANAREIYRPAGAA